LDLGGLTVVLDCAHGATYRVAPRVFRRLGARVLTIGTRPDGRNINAGCGALHPERLQRVVRSKGAAVGFAFDGDGDPLLCVDHTGDIRDGDSALALAVRHRAGRGRFAGDGDCRTRVARLRPDGGRR